MSRTDLVTRRMALHAGFGTATMAALQSISACSGSGSLPRLDIACGEPGGTYIQFGRLLGSAAVQEDLAIRADAVVTAGSVDNLARLRDHRAQLAMCLADSAEQSAWQPFAIGRVYQNYLQVVVPDASPIRSVEQLRGQRVSIGASGSGTAATTRRVFAALGLIDPQSGRSGAARPVEVMEMGLADAIAGVATDRLAALVFSSGIPIPALASSSAPFRVRLLDLSPVFDRLTDADRSTYVRTSVPAATYDMEQDVTTVGVGNLLLAHPDLPDETAASLVDLVLERARDLVPPPSTGMQFLTQQTLVDTMPVVLHPGAARRYRELHG